MFKLVLKRQRTRDQIANIRWIMEKASEFQKNIYFCFIDYAKALTLWTTINCGKFWKRWNTRPPDLALKKSVCRSGSNSSNWTWNNRLVPTGKGVFQVCILSPCLFNFYAEYIMRNAGQEKTQAGIKTAGRNINNLRYAADTTLMAESEEELKKASW